MYGMGHQPETPDGDALVAFLAHPILVWMLLERLEGLENALK